MTEPRCTIPPTRCRGDGGVQRHHVLGRGDDGRYIEPVILLPLCEPDDHQLGVHRLLEVAGLNGRRAATPGVLVGRIAEALRWLGWSRDDVPVVLPSATLFALGCELARIDRELRADEGQP